MGGLVVFFSNVSENTSRFVAKLGVRSVRIPVDGTPLEVDEPFVLITPTYGSGRGTRMAPVQVTKFLDDPQNAALLRGVVASGNTNFGSDFCKVGDEINRKHGVPVLHRFELMGMTPDVTRVQLALESVWAAEAAAVSA